MFTLTNVLIFVAGLVAGYLGPKAYVKLTTKSSL